jgi:hypothetical protein
MLFSIVSGQAYTYCKASSHPDVWWAEVEFAQTAQLYVFLVKYPILILEAEGN